MEFLLPDVMTGPQYESARHFARGVPSQLFVRDEGIAASCQDVAGRRLITHAETLTARWYAGCTLSRQMTRETDAIKRKQTFLLCRYVLIFATGALALIELASETSPLPVAILVGVAILSNMVLSQASPFSFFDAWMQAPVLVSDTAMISTCLLLTRASQEFFLFFFFVLIMAAKLEDLKLLAVGAALIGLASFLLAGTDAGWVSPVLMRIPFLFATGVFFGYVVLPERTGQMVGFNGKLPVSYVKRAANTAPTFYQLGKA